MNFDERKATITPNSPEYQRIHRWVVRTLGKAYKCSKDATHQSKRFDWSNISRQYLRNIEDWQQLCRACHRQYDGVTEEGRKKISEANKINSLGNTSHNTPIVGIHKITGKIKYYDSLTSAAKSVDALKTSISNCLAGRSNTAAKHYWHYAKERKLS
jgi:hypothetical protein